MSDPIVTTHAPKPVGAYPHARRVGNLLFLSGVGPRDPRDQSIPGLVRDEYGKVLEYDFDLQCHAVMRNVRAILDSAGCRWEDLVDVTIFLTNMARDFAAMNRIYAEYFTEAQPCRTTVEVNALPTPIAIEFKCIAEIKTG